MGLVNSRTSKDGVSRMVEQEPPMHCVVQIHWKEHMDE